MEIYLLIGIGILILGGGYLINKLSKDDTSMLNLEKFEKEKNELIEERAQLKSEIKQHINTLGKFSTELNSEKSKKDKLAGQGKQLFVEITELKEKNKTLQQKNEEQNKKIIGHEKEQNRREEKLEKKLDELEESKKSFEDEKMRIRKIDNERQNEIEEERNRVWNEHEISVLARIKEICQRKEIGFNFFDNNNLPESFDGSLKPDSLVELFPEQYLIFDAKFSESKISTYFTAQVPKTVEKIKKSKSHAQIYPTIFFVVPNDLIQNAKKVFAFADGFSFFMISPESLAPILSGFKKITEYEFADQLNPQDRENIVNVLSGYESFIRNQNAANILIAEKAVDVIHSKESLSTELLSEINLKRKNIKPLKLKEVEMKKLTQNIEEQDKKVKELTSPKEKKDLDEMQKTLVL